MSDYPQTLELVDVMVRAAIGTHRTLEMIREDLRRLPEDAALPVQSLTDSLRYQLTMIAEAHNALAMLTAPSDGNHYRLKVDAFAYCGNEIQLVDTRRGAEIERLSGDLTRELLGS